MGQIIELILRIRIDKKTKEQQMLDLNFVNNDNNNEIIANSFNKN